MSGAVSAALVSEAISRATSFLTGKFRKHNNVQEWIDRLVMARIEIESALLESEEFDINNDEPLHQWHQKLKEALCEADEALSNFQAKILHEKPNQTIEGGSSARDQQMKEEGSDDATLVHTSSNLREAVTRQVDLEANLAHDHPMQEGSDDATLVHPASNLRETVTRQFNLQVNLPHDPFMQEEGSDDATLVHPGSHLRETVTRQVDQEANLPHDQPMQEKGSGGATLVNPSKYDCLRVVYYFLCRYPVRTRTWAILGLLKSRKLFLGEYLENDKKVSKLKNTVEKLEKMAGNIGNFIKLLELQKKRKMSRKRKRSGVALQGFFLFISLKSQTYALFCYREDPYLLFIMLFRANCDIPTGITSDIFIGFIM